MRHGVLLATTIALLALAVVLGVLVAHSGDGTLRIFAGTVAVVAIVVAVARALVGAGRQGR